MCMPVYVCLYMCVCVYVCVYDVSCAYLAVITTFDRTCSCVIRSPKRYYDRRDAEDAVSSMDGQDMVQSVLATSMVKLPMEKQAQMVVFFVATAHYTAPREPSRFCVLA